MSATAMPVVSGGQYPRVLYGPNGMTIIASSAMEHEAMGAEWATEPGGAHLDLQRTLHPGSVSSPGAVAGTAPAVAPSPAVPAPAAPAFDADALAEQVALRVVELLADRLPRRPGRPPSNPETQEA